MPFIRWGYARILSSNRLQLGVFDASRRIAQVVPVLHRPEQIAEPPGLQRASGVIRLAVQSRLGRSRIASLRQQGCLKLLFPRIPEGAPLQAVAVNCSGGVAGGDWLQSSIACDRDTHLLLTTQAAERCYRARPGEMPARIAAGVQLAAGSMLEWLPQETILFEGASLRRTLDVEMEAGARLLCLESRIYGRAEHGEQLRGLDLSDRIVIRRGGRPLLVDAFRLHGDAETALSRAAIGAGAAASASILLAAPEAEDLLPAVRALLGGDAGASAWNGMLRVAMVSRDAQAHRAMIASALSVLRGGAALPAVWRC